MNHVPPTENEENLVSGTSRDSIDFETLQTVNGEKPGEELALCVTKRKSSGNER